MSLESWSEVYAGFVQRYRWFILVGWIVLASCNAYFATMFVGITTQSFAPIPGSQNYEALAAMKTQFPLLANSMNIVVYIECKASDKNCTVISDTIQNFTQSVCEDVNALVRQHPIIATCLGYYAVPIPSLPFPDFQRSFLATGNRSTVINIEANVDSFTSLGTTITDYLDDAVNKRKAQFLSGTSYTAGMNGVLFFVRSSLASVSRDLGMMDAIVLPLAMLVLAVFVRSVRLVLLPALCVGITASTSFAFMYYLGSSVLTVHSLAPSLMMSVMIAMSIDYSLFMLTRYREELHVSRGVECIAKVVATAGHTITVSGITFAACFMGLCAFGQEWLISIGVGNAIVIFMALFVNLSFVPALLLAFAPFFEKCVNPHGVWWKYCPKLLGGRDRTHINDESTDPSQPFFVKTERVTYSDTMYYRLGKKITKFPGNLLIILLVVGLSAPVGYHAFGFSRTDSNTHYLPRGGEVLNILKSMQKAFGAGYLQPYQFLIVPRNASDPPILSAKFFNQSATMIQTLLSDKRLPGTNVTMANGLMIRRGEVTNFTTFEDCRSNFNSDPSCGELIYMMEGMVNSAQQATWVSIILKIDPTGVDGNIWYQNAITILRNELGPQYGWDMYLLGPGSGALDSINNVYTNFPIIIFVSGGIVLVFLGFFFKSVLIPIRSVLSISLTLMFVFGLTTLVYEYGIFDFMNVAEMKSINAVVWAVPILSFSIVVGVGLDYDIFLLTRMMEYVDTEEDTSEVIVNGLASTGAIITTAGVIMAIAFSGLMLSEMDTMDQMGFVMVFAVLFDTFVVRTLLVPSIMSFWGRWNWWPSKLTKNSNNAATDVSGKKVDLVSLRSF